MSLSKTTPATPPSPEAAEPEWVTAVREKVRHLQFGTVQIKIHESQVVLVESIEQTRFDLAAKSRKGTS